MNANQAIDRTRSVIRRQPKALSTEEAYIFWLRRYIAALGAMPKELSSEKQLEQFLTDLAGLNDVSATSQNQAFNAILFFCTRSAVQHTCCFFNALMRSRSWAARSNSCLSMARLS